MDIGAQLYTIREYIQTPQTIEESLKKIAIIGYKTIQVSAIGEIEPKALRDIAKNYDLKIVVTHTNPDKVLNDIDTVINDHTLFDCKYVGLGSMPTKYRGSIEGLRQFIKEYTVVAKKLKDHGMKLQYHNHAFEYEKFDESVVFDVLVNETDPQLWGFILDTYWVQFAGRNPARQIEDLSGRIDVCHFKDMKIVDNKQQMAAVFEGNIYFDEVLAACKKTNVAHAMVEQDDCYGENPFDMLALSYNNLKKACSL